MNVIGISADWCDKCKKAKIALKDFDIEWLDVEKDFRAIDLMDFFNQDYIPFFVVEDMVEGELEPIRTFNSYLELGKWLEKI
jgi:hypothetical protein